MRPLLAAALAMVVATGACWYPDKGFAPSDAPPSDAPPPDAPPGPFDCNNKATKTTAPGQINVTGTVNVDFNPGGNTGPVAGATVQAFLGTDTTAPPIAFATSGGDGKFAMQYPTGGFAHPIVVTVTASGYLPTYYYPAVSVFADLDVRLELFKSTSASNFMILEGVNPLNLNLGAFAISVYDCLGNNLGGATVSTVPMAAMTPAVHYLVDNPDPQPSKDASRTDNIFGLAFAVNVPIDNTLIQATIPSPDHPSTILNLRSKLVPGVSNALIQVDIQP